MTVYRSGNRTSVTKHRHDMPRPKQRTAELKARLLRSALLTLDADGVPGFTTRGVARAAETSTPAVYELFGDRAGLVRAVFFEGFRLLAERAARLDAPRDPATSLIRLMGEYRAFVREHPALAQVMFSRPFGDFDPTAEALAAGQDLQRIVVHAVRRCIEADVMAGSAADIAHILLATAQGLAAQESAGWLGSSEAARDRRWRIGVRAVIAGFAPA